MASDDWKHRAAAGPRPGRPGAAAKGKGRSRLALALFPLLVAAGVAVGLFFWIRAEPAPLFLSLPVSEYDPAWPPNPWARQDAEGLRDALPKPDTGFIPTQSQELVDGFGRELAKLEDTAKKNSGQPVVVHLCALAVVDGDAVHVLPAKAGPGRKETWLPLARVLEAVANIRGDRLLLLDLRPVAEPRLGQTGAELATALAAELAAAESADRLPFLVGAYCTPAEYPYVSPELGRGVYAEFLGLGLAGRADGAVPGAGRDNEVSAVELVTYARTRVVQWLRKHGAPAVAPVLYGKGKDFVLRTVPQGTLPWADPQPAPATPAKVAEAWDTVDAWRATGAVHKTPRTFRELQETVARNARAAAGGGAEAALDLNLTVPLKGLAKQRADLEPTPYPVPTIGRLRRSPPDVLRPEKGPDGKEPKAVDHATEVRKIREALKLAGEAAEKKTRNEKAKEEYAQAAAALGKAQGAFWETPPEPRAPYGRTVLALFQDLIPAGGLTERSRDGFDQYLTTLRGLPGVPEYVELSYLAAVANEKVEERRQWPAELPRLLLTAAVAGEEAVAVTGRGLLRMSADLAEPDKTFRTSVGVLFTPSGTKWKQAAADLAPLEQAYRNAGKLGTAQAAAVAEWEEDVALLAGVGDFAPAARTTVDDAFQVLTEKVGVLRKAIDEKDPGAGLAERLTGAAGDALVARQILEAALKPVATGGPVENRARLRLALWSADDRKRWTKEADDAALVLAKAALAEPDAAAEDPRAPPPAAAPAPKGAGRARALLALVGETPPTGLRAALADRLVLRYRAAEAVADPVERATVREAFAWLIHPADLPATPDVDGKWHDPGADLRRAADRAAARWLIDGRYEPLVGVLAGVDKVQADRDLAPAARAAPQALKKDLSEVVQKLTGWVP